MQTLSDIIKPEDNGYRPPNIKYQTPGGFDLMDVMALPSMANHMSGFINCSRKPRLPGGSRRLADVAGFWSLARHEDVKKCDLDAKTFSSGTVVFSWAIAKKRPGPNACALRR